MTLDVKAWRMSRNDKAYTVRVGHAYIDKKGITQIEFDALPIPDKDGRVRVFLEERPERDDDAPRGRREEPRTERRQADTRRAPTPVDDDMDDDLDRIPF